MKCKDCGFLSVRSTVDSSIKEADYNYREKGMVAIGRDERGLNQHAIHEKRPFCILNAYNLGKEILEQIGTGRSEEQSVLDIIQKDRTCGSYIDWQMGFSPKEHREMLDRKLQLDFQLKQEEANRKWQTRQNWQLVIVAGIFTLLGTVIGTVLAIVIN